jgi:hypothetical protein
MSAPITHGRNTVTMTKTNAASNGSKASTPDKPTHGLIVLREEETQGLISLASRAMSQTGDVIHDLHQVIYHHGEVADSDSSARLRMLNEALRCLRTTEHYLLMLSSVFEEQDNANCGIDPWSVEPAF